MRTFTFSGWQVLETNLMGGVIIGGLAAFVGLSVAGSWVHGTAALLMCLMLLWPIGQIFECPPDGRRWLTALITVGIGAIGCLAWLPAVMPPSGDMSRNPLFIGYMVAILGSPLFGNAATE